MKRQDSQSPSCRQTSLTLAQASHPIPREATNIAALTEVENRVAGHATAWLCAFVRIKWRTAHGQKAGRPARREEQGFPQSSQHAEEAKEVQWVGA